MSSIIQGYNYDIFISYRQKDNKYDGWVTEFVDNLKKELEATFKEEINVYFDINPHDGLLETYDVDESLREKLKCLIFIPIISRTYCDPRSFAWEHEFKAFIEEASKDKFGLKVKLLNGNVACRILPIRIYDLDSADIKLCESALGSMLRGIEFIYKEPGVNRPLKPDDDEKINLTRTKYRNQINKVGNAIKELLTVLEHPMQESDDTPREVLKPATDKHKRKKVLPFAGSVILAAIILTGIFFLSKLGKASEKVEKSIAVLPFINDSPSDSNKYFIDGVMVEILNNLQAVKDLRVISRTSAEKYRNTTKSIPEIAKELGVNYIVEGSGQKSGNKIRLTINLLRTIKEIHLWGNSYDKEIYATQDIFDIQSQVAKSITSELKAIVNLREKQTIEKIPTRNLEAYDAVMMGNYYTGKGTADDFETALKYYELAKEKDPKYALAYVGIAFVWIVRQQLGWASTAEARPQIIEASMKAIELDNTSAEVHSTLGSAYFFAMWDWEESENEYEKAIELNPNDAGSRMWHSNLLACLGRNEEALNQAEIALNLDPQNESIFYFYGVELTFAHKFNEAIKAFQGALKINSASSPSHGDLGITLALIGRYKEAVEQFKLSCANDSELINAYENGYIEGGFRGALLAYIKAIELRFNNSFWSPYEFALSYSLIGEKDKAFYWLEEAYKVHDPRLPYLLHPVYDNLHNDTRFQDLCRKMKLPY